jgi:hypothetical protein
LRATVKNIKNIVIKAIKPIPDRSIAIFKPRFLRLMMKITVTEMRASKPKRTEKYI